MGIESSSIAYSDGWKYRLEDLFRYKIHFSKQMGLDQEYIHPDRYYALKKDVYDNWWIEANVGCCWDGPSGPMPDHDFMMAPSLIHDILHWLIRRGAILEAANHMIDYELERAINYYKVDPPAWQGGNLFGLKKWRAKWIRRATHTCNEKAGSQLKIRRINLK